MKLYVNSSQNLGFLSSAYEKSNMSAKALAGRLRMLLSSSKEAYVLEGVVEFPGPYVIEDKLQMLHSKISGVSKGSYRDSILNVTWNSDTICDGNDTARECTYGESPHRRNYVSKQYEDIDSATPSDLFITQFYGFTNEKQPRHGTGGIYGRRDEEDERFDYDDMNSWSDCPNQNNVRTYRSLSNLSYGSQCGGVRSYGVSSASSFLDTPSGSDQDISESPTPSHINERTSELDGLGILCSHNILNKGMKEKREVTLDEIFNQHKSNALPTQNGTSNDDILDEERNVVSMVCQVLRRILMFLVSASNRELNAMRTFDSILLECIQLLEDIAKDSSKMVKSITNILKRYTSAYVASETEYQNAAAKFMKLEKSLEVSLLSRIPNCVQRSESDLKIECGFKNCYSNGEVYKQYRNNNWNLMKEMMKTPKDFVLYTNYIEQLCISGYLHDNLIKNREKFTKRLTGVLGMFAEHYPRCIYSKESEFISKITSVSSNLLQSTYIKMSKMDLCYSAAEGLPEHGVIDLRFAVNIKSSSMRDKVHATIVECFERIKKIVKALSMFHLSQIDRFSRFGTRSPFLFCSADLSTLFDSYRKYHKHLYSIYWSIFSTINTAFPKTPKIKRNNDTQQPLLGEFREVKLPFNLFDTVMRQLEAVVKISKEHSFDICNASVKICQERQSWLGFIQNLANQNRLNNIQLVYVVNRAKEIGESNKISGLPFPSDGDGSHSGESLEVGECEENLIVLKEQLQVCKSSKIIVKMLYAVEDMAEALVDYNEDGYSFSFKKGDKIHVRIAGNTPLWLGHTAEGTERWFPAKYVKLKGSGEISLFRMAEIECDTYLDGYKISGKDEALYTNKRDMSITLSSKALLKQSLILSQLGLQGKVEYEFKCSISRKIVLRGTLYLTKSHMGFISSFNDITLFGSQTTLTVPMKDIVSCELTAGKLLPFYVNITLRNGEVHMIYSVTNSRRIRDAIKELSGIEGCDSHEVVNAAGIDSVVSTDYLKTVFGVLEPLSKKAPSVSLNMSLKEFFNKHLSDHDKAGCRVADSRLSQNAFNFSGNLEPVVFDWNHGGIQFHTRNISYNFRLKEGKFTSLVPVQNCGKANEELKYALVNRSMVIYESTNYVSDIPYSKYFYTILRITAITVSDNVTLLNAEYDIKFLKSTMFSSVITAEACDRLLHAIDIIRTPGSGHGEKEESSQSGNAHIAMEGTQRDIDVFKVEYSINMKTVIYILLIFFFTYSSWAFHNEEPLYL